MTTRDDFIGDCGAGYAEDAADDAYEILCGIYYAPDFISECKLMLKGLDDADDSAAVPLFKETLTLLLKEMESYVEGKTDLELRKCEDDLSDNDDNIGEPLESIFQSTADMVDAGKKKLKELEGERQRAIWSFCEEYFIYFTGRD